MVDKINKKIKEINSFIPKSEKEIEEFRIKYLGKKGELTSLFLDFKNLDNDKKKTVGKLLNELSFYRFDMNLEITALNLDYEGP